MPKIHHDDIMTIRKLNKPDRSKPGPMTAPSAGRHQGRGDKYTTGTCITQIRGRDNITIGTWNVRTLRPEGKLEELQYELERYRWHVIGLSEVRWKFHGETCTDEGHKLYYSGNDSKHEHGVGFLVHKDIVNTVMGCRPVSDRLITLRLKATPFNITIIQVYVPTSSHSDDEVDSFYNKIQTLVDETPKKDILIITGDWNAKVGVDAQSDWKDVCGPYCNLETNERGIKLLEFATYNNMVLTNTLGPHKASRRWTWHSPDGNHHNQIDYTLVRKRFRSGVNVARTRSFPGADVGSDHDLLMTTFRVRLSKTKKPKQLRKKFDLEKLRDPAVAQDFKTDLNFDSVTDTFNTALKETVAELLGK